MIVEIRGTGTRNKGAELMLLAIQQYFLPRIPDVKFAVSAMFGPYTARAKYGLLTKLIPHRFGRSRIAQAFMSESFRQSYGLVVEEDIDVVLDASGFAFGDQWGAGPSTMLAQAARDWKKRGTSAVLLPQAFGPFDDDRVRSEFKAALNNIELVYARDRTSFDYIQALGGPYQHVKLAPDFTCIVKGTVPQDGVMPNDAVCIVPNIRMMDRTGERESNSYIGFLAVCINTLEREGFRPVLVFHERKNDRKVADLLEAELSRKVQVIKESDPVRLKGILGQAVAVIGSRFHALVGALSQGVPSLGTSWSHKYEMLFADYGCDEWVLSPASAEDRIRAVVIDLCSSDVQSQLRQKLSERSASVCQAVEQMFQDVERVIGI